MNMEDIADAFEGASHESKQSGDHRPPSIETTVDGITRDLRLAAADRAGAEYLRRQPIVRGQPLVRAGMRRR